MKNPYQKYKTNTIITATSEELTLMLYNGAIRFCNICIEAIDNKDIQRANYSNQKAQAIIVELRATLDTKLKVAQDIDRLYAFIIELLVEANMRKDKEKVEQALNFIREFRDTWEIISGRTKKVT